MSRKNNKSKNIKRTSDSISNPRAGARRNLLRTIGGSGAVAVGAMTAGWQTPIVKSVILPAHAQGSPQSSNVISCPVTIRVDGDTPGNGPYTITLGVTGNTAGAFSVGTAVNAAAGASASVSFSSNFGTDITRVGGGFSVASGGTWTRSLFVTCCADTYSFSNTQQPGGAGTFGTNVAIIIGSGGCIINPE